MPGSARPVKMGPRGAGGALAARGGAGEPAPGTEDGLTAFPTGLYLLPVLGRQQPRESTAGGNPMAERVLVTGGLGYLGSILCEHLLDAGFDVSVVDNLMYASGEQGLFHLCAHPSFDFARGDVRDEALMRSVLRRADVVVHLAAVVGAGACDRDPALATAVNLDAVRLLARLRS